MFRAIVLLALVATGMAIVFVSAPLAFALSPSTPSIVAAAWFDQVVGAGDVVSVPRSVAPFQRIVVGGSIDVRATIGGAQSVVVEAQQNIADIIETNSQDGTLTITTHKSYATRKRTLVRVTVPELRGLDVRGSANAVLEGVRSQTFDISIRGSGDVTASGGVDHLNYSSYGSGDGRLRSLTAQDAVVRLAGSGDAQLDVVRTLDVEVKGSGDVTYSGAPKVIRQVVRGSGSVSQS